MKAIVQEGYGPAERVLRLAEVDRPAPQRGEVLVRVRAASVHPDVWHVVNGFPFLLRLMGAGLSRPKDPIPGTDLAGVVEEVGEGVTDLQPGDEVFGESHDGFQWQNGGTFAEYVAVPERVLARKPKNVTFEQAATVPTAGIIELHNLQNGERVQPGQSVLVNGAAGGVGSIALQVAKARGARVTGVDRTDKLELVRSLGAGDVIDYTQEDFTRRGERYDLIFDVASNLSLSACKRVLTEQGKYVVIGHDHYGAKRNRLFGSVPQMFRMVALTPFDRHLSKPDFALPRKKAVMGVLMELLESGRLTPVVARTYPLSEAVEALRRLQAGDALGRIVLTP